MAINYPNVIILKEEDKTTVKLEEKRLVTVGIAAPLKTVEPRSHGLLADKAFYLPDYYDWIIVKDNKSMLCLVPLRKTID